MAVGQPRAATMAYRLRRWNTRARSSSSRSGQSAKMSNTKRASCWSRPVIAPDWSFAKRPAAMRCTTPVEGSGKVFSNGDLRASQLKAGSSATSFAGAAAGRSVTSLSTVWASRVRASSRSGGLGRRGAAGRFLFQI